MFTSRRSTFLEETITVSTLWRRRSAPQKRSVKRAGKAMRTYSQGECALTSGVQRFPSDLKPLEQPDSMMCVIRETPSLSAFSWRSTRRRTTHQWEDDTPTSREGKLHTLSLTLLIQDKPWIEPLFLMDVTPIVWSEIKGQIKEITALFDLPLLRIPAGPTPVIFTHGSGAVMVHELIGHPCEAQVWAERLSPFIKSLNVRLGPESLTVIDDPTCKDLPGFQEVDDEGWECKPQTIIKNGRLVGILGDTLHSHLLPCRPGRGRVMDYTFFPTARMTNTRILEGPDDLDATSCTPRKRLEIVRLEGGTFLPDGRVVLTVRLGVIWEGHHPLGRVRNVVLTGEIFDLMQRIEAIGKRPVACRNFGWCTRSGQRIAVGAVSPDLFVERMEIL